MSDLLPLVVTVLNDQAAIDAMKEISDLKRQLKSASAIEVIGWDEENPDKAPTVFASGQFEDGLYSNNPNLWQVDLHNTAGCRLVDLRGCRICVGGGIPLESLDDQQDNRAYLAGVLDLSADDTDTSKVVRVCFCPNSTWLSLVVHGWPRQNWEAAVRGEQFDADGVISFLVDTIAPEFPEATVSFDHILMVERHIPVAFQRFLSPESLMVARAERIGRESEE